MCGRYTLKTDRHIIQKRFGLEDLPPFEPRYNLGPAQDGLILRPGQEPGTRTAAWLRWGLVPGWTKEGSSPPMLINVRSETAASKAVSREAFRRRRCLVIADGFFEWTRKGTQRLPHHFTMHQGEPFAMAGIWERWRPPGADNDERLETFAILTTAANDLVSPHHDRMPVIIAPELYDDWINPLVQDPDVLKRMLAPFPAIEMAGRRVSVRVNSIKNDDPACLEPPTDEDSPDAIADKEQGQLGLNFG